MPFVSIENPTGFFTDKNTFRLMSWLSDQAHQPAELTCTNTKEALSHEAKPSVCSQQTEPLVIYQLQHFASLYVIYQRLWWETRMN